MASQSTAFLLVKGLRVFLDCMLLRGFRFLASILYIVMFDLSRNPSRKILTVFAEIFEKSAFSFENLNRYVAHGVCNYANHNRAVTIYRVLSRNFFPGQLPHR